MPEIESVKMTYWELLAWFELASVVLAVATFLILLPGGPLVAYKGFAWIALTGFFALLKKKPQLIDERDSSIQQRCAVLAFRVFWLAFVFITVAITSFCAGQLIPVGYLILFPCFGWAIFGLSRSISTILEYRRDVHS